MSIAWHHGADANVIPSIAEYMATILTDRERAVIASLREAQRLHDANAKLQVAKHRARNPKRRLDARERAEICRDAPLAITDDVGALLYDMVHGRRALIVVEFGASLGVSTIFLAAALRAHGGGRLITSEIEPVKARALSRNLRRAGLDGLVELRVGDALETLQTIEGPIDFICLDGWNELYLPILQMLEPSLSGTAAVAADLSANDPELLPYLAHVREDAKRWVSITAPFDAGVEVSMQAPCSSSRR